MERHGRILLPHYSTPGNTQRTPGSSKYESATQTSNRNVSNETTRGVLFLRRQADGTSLRILLKYRGFLGVWELLSRREGIKPDRGILGEITDEYKTCVV